MPKILIIQTAFIGDAVLATALAEKLKEALPEAVIHFLVRKGNESLLDNNPHINRVLIWNKQQGKLRSMFKIMREIRKEKYEEVINVQRFFSTGLMTALSGARSTSGFNKNPLSFTFKRKIKHRVMPRQLVHETERNQELIHHLAPGRPARPRLYPSKQDVEKIMPFTASPFITITPSSVWFTKQYPAEKWIDFLQQLPEKYTVYLLGGKGNFEEAEDIRRRAGRNNATVLAGQLSFLQSAALMQRAVMNYVNDSAPLHFASATNAPVTAVYCSTIPGFGYYPLSDYHHIVQTTLDLECRPCGLHGHKACPMGHFKCALTIETEQLLKPLYADR